MDWAVAMAFLMPWRVACIDWVWAAQNTGHDVLFKGCFESRIIIEINVTYQDFSEIVLSNRLITLVISEFYS